MHSVKSVVLDVALHAVSGHHCHSPTAGCQAAPEVLGNSNSLVAVWDGVVAELKRRLLRVPLRTEEGHPLVLDGRHVLHALPAHPRPPQSKESASKHS